MNVTFNYYLDRSIPSNKIIKIVFETLKPIFQPKSISTYFNYDEETTPTIFGVSYRDHPNEPLLNGERLILDNKFTVFEGREKNILDMFLDYLRKKEIFHYQILAYGNLLIHYPINTGLETTWAFREYWPALNQRTPLFGLQLVLEKENEDVKARPFAYMHDITIRIWHTSIFLSKSNKFEKQLESSEKNIQLISTCLNRLYSELYKINKNKISFEICVAKSKSEWLDRVLTLFKKEIPELHFT